MDTGEKAGGYMVRSADRKQALPHKMKLVPKSPQSNLLEMRGAREQK
jgi:hypothetical protein